MADQLPNQIRIYALSVCFASMVVGSISLSIAIYDALQYSFPEAMHPQIKNQLQSSVQARGILELQSQDPQLTENQKGILSQQLMAVDSIQPQQIGYAYFQSRALESLVGSSITLFVALLVFLFHWRLATKHEYSGDT